jgi:hypothetical protein
MHTIAPMIVQVGNVSLWMAEQMLKDVRPEQFARQPRGEGGAVVRTNTPAFVYGHLSLYPAMMMEMTGNGVPDTSVPDGFQEVFKAGAECRDDPEGNIYPSMEAVTSHFFRSHRAALARIGRMSDQQLTAPNPREGRMKELFLTVGSMLNFSLSAHIMMHLGQISAWRRCMGLGTVM